MPVIVDQRGSARVIVVELRSAVAVRKPETPAVAVTVPTPVGALTADTRTVEVAARGAQGPAGPAGRDGAAPQVSYPVGEVIHGQRVVRLADGLVFHPDTSVVDHALRCIGVATQSAGSGDVVVQLAGALTESSWNWADGPVWCGPDGSLTQNPASTGWLLCVGRAAAPTVLMIDLETPIGRN